MNKINQGRYEVFTTKADAIEKFMQMQGSCREELSDRSPIEFYCQKNGEILISNLPSSRSEYRSSTDLFGEVVEQDGKTYVTYYTSFSKANNVLKTISLIFTIIIAIVAIVLAFVSGNKMYSVVILALCLVLFVSRLVAGFKEEKNSPKDSEILINELEKRVKAVNLWDK